MSSSFFLFMCAFVSGLLSNTVIMLLMFMLLTMTNNQPQVWISGHKLLVFRGFMLQSSQLFTECVFFSILCNFISLYLMFNYFHCLIMLIVTINYLLHPATHANAGVRRPNLRWTVAINVKQCLPLLFIPNRK